MVALGQGVWGHHRLGFRCCGTGMWGVGTGDLGMGALWVVALGCGVWGHHGDSDGGGSAMWGMRTLLGHCWWHWDVECGDSAGGVGGHGVWGHHRLGSRSGDTGMWGVGTLVGTWMMVAVGCGALGHLWGTVGDAGTEGVGTVCVGSEDVGCGDTLGTLGGGSGMWGVGTQWGQWDVGTLWGHG